MRTNSVSWLWCWNRSIYKLPPSFIKYLTIWWQRLLLCKEVVLSFMFSVYGITDQNNIYFSFCLMILVYNMKLTNIISKLGKMGRAVPASPFFYLWIHLIETAMCLWQVSSWRKQESAENVLPPPIRQGEQTSLQELLFLLSLITLGMNHQQTLVLEFGQTDCNVL